MCELEHDSLSESITGIAADIQFLASRITKLEVDNNLPTLNKAKKKLSLGYDILDISQREDGIFGQIGLKVKVTVGNGGKDDSELLKLGLGIVGAFYTEKQIPENEFQYLMEHNGLAVLYGIARAYILSVSSLTFESETINLPMINVFEFVKKQEAQENREKAQK